MSALATVLPPSRRTAPRRELPVVDRFAADDQLARDIERALSATGRPPLRQLQVSAVDGRVLLEGALPSYYLKQLAQETARAVAGTKRVVNQTSVLNTASSI